MKEDCEYKICRTYKGSDIKIVFNLIEDTELRNKILHALENIDFALELCSKCVDINNFSEFIQNNIMYNSSISFINGVIQGILSCIKNENSVVLTDKTIEHILTYITFGEQFDFVSNKTLEMLKNGSNPIDYIIQILKTDHGWIRFIKDIYKLLIL